MTQAVSDEVVADFLAELDGWESAYPLSAFPEPDLKKAAELLKAGGMTLDAVSASNMRHVVSCIAPKARAAIAAMRPHDPDVKSLVEAVENIRDDSNQVVGRRGGLDPKLSRICETADAALAPFKDRDRT